MKKNCWELLFCGREQGGARAAEKGVCPAASDTVHEGKNGGRYAGRYCWRVSGTLCGGQIQGDWAAKLKDCHACKFYQLVERQEGEDFVY
jgi:hypothetical protein